QRRIDAARRAERQQPIGGGDQEERLVGREQVGGAIDRELEHLVEGRGVRERAAHLGELPDLFEPVLVLSNEVLHARASTMRTPRLSIRISRGWRSWATPRPFATRSVRPTTPFWGSSPRKTMLSVM